MSRTPKTIAAGLAALRRASLRGAEGMAAFRTSIAREGAPAATIDVLGHRDPPQAPPTVEKDEGEVN